jgi:predicted DNA-binding transcriptional regulator AlpA
MPYGIKLGGRRLWRESELDSWIAGGCKPVRTPGSN